MTALSQRLASPASRPWLTVVPFRLFFLIAILTGLTSCQQARRSALPAPISIDPTASAAAGSNDPGRAVLYSPKFNCQISEPPVGWVLSGAPTGQEANTCDASFERLDKRLRASFQALPIADPQPWLVETAQWAQALASASPPAEYRYRGETGGAWQVWTGRSLEGRWMALYSFHRLEMGYQFDFSSPPGLDGGTEEEEKAFRAAAESLVDCFGLIDPTAFAYDERRAPGVLRDSPLFGYRLIGEAGSSSLAEGLRNRLQEPGGTGPDFAWVAPEGFIFQLWAFHLGSLRPNLDALSEAFGKVFAFSPEHPNVHDFRRLHGPGWSGEEFEQDGRGRPGFAEKGQWRMVRLLQRPPFVYLLISSAPADFPAESRAAARAFLDRLVFRTVPPDLAGGPDLTRETAREYAALFNLLGLHYFQRGELTACQDYFQEARRLDPGHPNYLVNLAENLLTRGLLPEARQVLEGGRTLFPRYPDLRARLAHTLNLLGEPDQALLEYRLAHAEGLQEENWLAQYGRLLIAQNQPGEALALMEAVAGHLDSDLARLVEAEALYSTGQTVLAMERLRALSNRIERVPGIAWRLAEWSMAEGDYEEARRWGEALAATGREPHGYYLAGYALFLGEHIAEARRAFETALQANPADQESSRMIALCDAALGRHEAASFADDLPPVEPPQALRDRLFEEREPPHARDYGGWSDYIGRAIAHRPGQPLRQTYYYRTQVCDRATLDDLQEIVLPYFPLYEKIQVNRLRVWNAAGQTVSENDVSGSYVGDDRGSSLVTLKKELHVPIPGLEVGGGYEAIVTKEGLHPRSELDFLPLQASGWHPRGLVFVWLEGDRSRVGWKATNGFQREVFPNGWLWTVENPPPFQEVDYAPADAEAYPELWIGSTNRSWASLVREYDAQIQSCLAPDAEAAALGRKLAEGATAPLEISQRLLRYLQDEFIYRGVLFGVRAQIPNQPADILNNRYGDCKDHTVLFVQMARAAGLEAYPALVHSAGDFVPEIPSLDQFDHMIVYLPTLGEQPFLDPSDKQLPAGLVPRELGGAMAVIVDPQHPGPRPIPNYSEDSSNLRVEREARLDDEGRLEVAETVILDGYSASWLRDYLAASSPHYRARTVAEFLRPAVPGLTPREVSVDNLADRHLPLRINYRYTHPQPWQARQNRWSGPLPATWEMAVIQLRSPAAEGRSIPIHLKYPLRVEAVTRWVIAGVGEPSLPASSGHVGLFGLWHGESVKIEGALEYRFLYRLPSGRYPATAMPALAKWLAELASQAAPWADCTMLPQVDPKGRKTNIK